MMTAGSLFAGVGGNQLMSNRYTYNVPFTPAQLAADYQSGMSQVEIAAKWSTTQKVVFHAMRKFAIPRRRRVKRNQRGAFNSCWKGDAATYKAFHYRLYAAKGRPQHCEICGTSDPEKSYDWANLTGRYQDIDDYKRMCRSCHWKYDKKQKNLGEYAVKQEVAREKTNSR